LNATPQKALRCGCKGGPYLTIHVGILSPDRVDLLSQHLRHLSIGENLQKQKVAHPFSALRNFACGCAKVSVIELTDGIEPRHLRAFRTAAEREVGLVEQVVSPIRRSREDGAEGRAAQAINDIAALSVRLHASLVKVGLRSLR